MSKYVIVDFEMCDVPKGAVRKHYNYGTEIIEIGAVLLDNSLNIVDNFKSYVAPQYGYINRRVCQLTKISFQDVIGAPCFKDAMEMFLAWMPEDATLVSWSENDEIQVKYELENKNLDIPQLDRFFGNWLDCQKTFAEKMSTDKNYNLTEALRLTGIDYEDGAHDALVDARNTALLFAKMEREPELQLSHYYTEQCSDHLTLNPFAELFAKLEFAV